jgi:citrate synthase
MSAIQSDKVQYNKLSDFIRRIN